MTWMQTYTGKAFYPTNPDPELIDEVDIAHALSMLCRYNGHVNSFYSVAQHCVLLSYAVDPKNAFWALMHDATEAYVGDMIRPLKQQMPEFSVAEDKVMLAICKKFGMYPEMPEQVKEYDTRILVNESAALMQKPPQAWFGGAHVEPLPIERIFPWSQKRAEVLWTTRFMELTGEITVPIKTEEEFLASMDKAVGDYLDHFDTKWPFGEPGTPEPPADISRLTSVEQRDV